MRESVTIVLWALCLCAGTLLADRGPEPRPLPPGKGLILPIQDRAGSPDTVEYLSLLTRQSLSESGAQLTEVVGLRDSLRRMRIREATTATSEKLLQLSRILGTDWLVSTTLHELVREPIPQITLSAQIFRPETTTLDWSGFVSMTGLDRQTWLGLGEVDSLDELLRRAIGELFADFASGPSGSPKKRLPHSKHGFLREPVPPSTSGAVAVIPFDSIVDRDALRVAELQTRAWIAALDRGGFRVVRPGAVHQVMRERGQLLLGEVDRSTALELATRLGVEWVLTGTVETYKTGSGLLPDPWVAIGARLIHSDSGRIFWSDGRERQGSDSQTLFQQGRIYSAADLSLEMVHSMIAGFSKP